jgi:hypothetical protein
MDGYLPDQFNLMTPQQEWAPNPREWQQPTPPSDGEFQRSQKRARNEFDFGFDPNAGLQQPQHPQLPYQHPHLQSQPHQHHNHHQHQAQPHQQHLHLTQPDQHQHHHHHPQQPFAAFPPLPSLFPQTYQSNPIQPELPYTPITPHSHTVQPQLLPQPKNTSQSRKHARATSNSHSQIEDRSPSESISSPPSAAIVAAAAAAAASSRPLVPPPGEVECCVLCGTTESPEWRRNESGIKDLCNA